MILIFRMIRSVGQTVGMLEPDAEIMCIDCGGRCHLLTAPREDDRWEPGDIVAYRCVDCLDRWDLVLPDTDEDVWRGDR